MLFGNKEVQKIVIEKAKEIAEDAEGKLVYASMVGSISRGTQCADSDYDTRFLYIKKDFPQNIWYPDKYKEDELVKRYYPKEHIFYDKIPLWELTSFLYYLVKPSVGGKFSTGLYHLIGWTFGSPYNWDPYGLTNRLWPLFKEIFEKKYEIDYQLEIITECYSNDNEIILSEYIYAVIAAASIKYVLRYNLFPPINYNVLLACVDDDRVLEKVQYLLDLRREESMKMLKQCDKPSLGLSHYLVRVPHISELDQYIMDNYKLGKNVVEDNLDKKTEYKEKKVKEMYYLVAEAMKEQDYLNIRY